MNKWTIDTNIIRGENNTEICTMDTCWSDWETHARLIASAPDLLEALEALFDLLESEEPRWYLAKHYNIAKDAIEKAKCE